MKHLFSTHKINTGTVELEDWETPKIAGNPKTEPNRLTRLVCCPIISIAMKAASNPSTPVDAIRYAVLHAPHLVRCHALANPACPMDLLNDIADKHLTVAEQVLLKGKVPSATVLDVLVACSENTLLHKDLLVRAALVGRHTGEDNRIWDALLTNVNLPAYAQAVISWGDVA